MRSPAKVFMVTAMFAVLLAGCTGSGLFNKLYNIPTPTPSPVIAAAPTSFSFNAGNKGPATLTASETNGNTFFTATTTDATIATVTTDPVSTNVFHVTATGKVGTCNITISDGSGGSLNVPITFS
jgi:hypothetical protein